MVCVTVLLHKDDGIGIFSPRSF